MGQTGKVWLVGAGPGDAGLLTIKAKQLLMTADVVIYDQLVGDAILGMIPTDIETINVGKRAGNHTMPQLDINALLCSYAKKGKRVVRLKGGDPFLFGRGGEEVESLIEQNIPFEEVPGVTSAIAVPAYNGIPVTHRDFASSVHIITGHKKSGEADLLPYQAYVETKGTLVFLMGLQALPRIVKGLLDAGMPKTMPAAVLQKGTTAAQRRAVATLETIEAETKKQNIHTPAIIIIGEVCALSPRFEWYEKQPLFGCKMYVTRPQNRSSFLTKRLRELGAEVIELPSIKTVKREINEEIRFAYERLSDFRYILFTSPFGVQSFLEQLKELHIDIRRIGGAKLGAIGNATKKALEQAGLFVDYMPDIYEGRALGQMIASVCQPGDKILLPRAAIGSQELIEQLTKEKQVYVTDLPIYDTINADASCAFISGCKTDFAGGEKQNVSVFFTSASTVKGFASLFPALHFTTVKALCIGEQTKKAAQKLGMQTFVAKEATMESLIELALKLHVNI